MNVGTVLKNLYHGENSFPHVSSWFRKVYVVQFWPMRHEWMFAGGGIASGKGCLAL